MLSASRNASDIKFSEYNEVSVASTTAQLSNACDRHNLLYQLCSREKPLSLSFFISFVSYCNISERVNRAANSRFRKKIQPVHSITEVTVTVRMKKKACPISSFIKRGGGNSRSKTRLQKHRVVSTKAGEYFLRTGTWSRSCTRKG